MAGPISPLREPSPLGFYTIFKSLICVKCTGKILDMLNLRSILVTDPYDFQLELNIHAYN